MSYVRWLFWCIVYAFRSEPRNLQDYVIRGIRRRVPWWKFKPCVQRNDIGKHWDIWLEDETSYAEDGVVLCTIHRAMSDNRIVGITLYDYVLDAGRTDEVAH